jgi:TonB family protein
MPTRASPWLVALGVTLLSIGCRSDDSTTPVDGHRELCCRAASPDNVSFTGCRATSHCRANEEIWVRGPVTCGPADPQACDGGRCCKLDLATLATPALATSPEPSGDLTSAPTQAPAAVPISPIPLDWRATPSVIAIPKLVCPATGEGELEGTVLLRVSVDADGRVRAVELRRGFDPRCDELAHDALLHAQFEPARTPAGEPIPATLTWSYQFGGE